MADISFLSLLTGTIAFLSANFIVPVWLFLILFATSVPQFIKMYKWLRKSKKAEKIAKTIQDDAKHITHTLAENKFTESMISTVQKLRSMPENSAGDSSVLSKIKNVAQNAGGAATDGLAAAAKKFEEDMKPTTPREAPKKAEQGVDELKQIILQKLFKVGDNGRLPESIASDIGLSSIKTNNYLDELTTTKLIDKRKTTLGDTYFITKMGKAFCEKQGYKK